ncbi:hypothetical protein QIS74_13125 [Colletotrichum tabaci]|uniref:Uncharacterized protein n=1 Tax=Colletotrichum tabaci TaxID=1209068 RepID=A0AAV9SVR7_9PEZI
MSSRISLLGGMSGLHHKKITKRIAEVEIGLQVYRVPTHGHRTFDSSTI